MTDQEQPPNQPQTLVHKLVVGLSPDTTPIPGSAPQPGDRCPQCGEGGLDYDGVLNLACSECGYMLAGCST